MRCESACVIVCQGERACARGRWRSLATGRTSPLRLIALRLIAASCGLFRRQVAEFGNRTHIAVAAHCGLLRPLAAAGGGVWGPDADRDCGAVRRLQPRLHRRRRPRRLRLRHRRWGRLIAAYCGLLRLIAPSLRPIAPSSPSSSSPPVGEGPPAPPSLRLIAAYCGLFCGLFCGPLRPRRRRFRRRGWGAPARRRVAPHRRRAAGGGGRVPRPLPRGRDAVYLLRLIAASYCGRLRRQVPCSSVASSRTRSARSSSPTSRGGSSSSSASWP